MVGLRELTRKSEELLTLAVSVVEQQAEELRVNTSRGAEGCGHEADAVIVRMVRLILRRFFLGSFLERLVDVGRVTQLVHLVRVVRVAPPLILKGDPGLRLSI